MTTNSAVNIAGTSFTLEEEAELIRLLGKVRQDNCRWPTEQSMRAGHGVVSYWAPEIVITQYSHKGTEILLAIFDGGVEKWREEKFWHLPGGYNTIRDHVGSMEIVQDNLWGSESIQPVVSRIAKRELRVDVEIDPEGTTDLFWWPQAKPGDWHEERGEHPYGSPLSVYVQCKFVNKDFEESEKVRFWPVDELPSPIVKSQKEYILRHFVR